MEKNGKKRRTIEKIREFNRFYIPKIDILNKTYMHSGYSATEARILFEISQNKEKHANNIAEKLGIDKSYLSRILKKFEKQGLIKRTISPEDNRFYCINPTKKCEKLVSEIIKKVNENLSNLLKNVDEEKCEKIYNALNTIITCILD